jgi:hypothetical protein
MQGLRETLGDIAQNSVGKEQLAASRAIKGFDEFLPNVDPSHIVAGTPTDAARVQQLFEQGRGNYAAAMRSNNITGELDRATTGILERAENRAQAANSGRNLDNTIRSKLVAALEKPKEVSGYSDAEIEAMNAAAMGGGVRNTARYIGNLAGGGGGIGQTGVAALGAGLGGSVGGIPGMLIGAAVPASVGATGKSIANALAKRSLNGVDELIRQRSPLYEEMLANTPMGVISPEKRAALIRVLMMQQAGQQ